MSMNRILIIINIMVCFLNGVCMYVYICMYVCMYVCMLSHNYSLQMYAVLN